MDLVGKRFHWTGLQMEMRVDVLAHGFVFGHHSGQKIATIGRSTRWLDVCVQVCVTR